MRLRWPVLVIATLSLAWGTQFAQAQAINATALSIPLSMSSTESITLTNNTPGTYNIPNDGTFGTPISFTTSYNLGTNGGQGRTLASAAYFASSSALTNGSFTITTAQITEQSTTAHLSNNNSTGTGACNLATVNGGAQAWFSSNQCPTIYMQGFPTGGTGTETSTVQLKQTAYDNVTNIAPAGSWTGTLFIGAAAN